MRLALDTNLLAYAEGVNDIGRRDQALGLLQRLPSDVVVAAQCLGELFAVLVRKAGRTPQAAKIAVLAWRDAFAVAETSGAVLAAAADLAAEHKFGIWDAIVLSASAEAGARLLLSEDMQTGFTWRGVTIVNPFAEPAHPLLTAALS